VELGSEIDFAPTTDYGITACNSILSSLTMNRIDRAEKLWGWFGQNEKIPPIGGKIKTFIAEAIAREMVDVAHQTYVAFGGSYDLSDGVRTGFFSLLRRGYVHSTYDLKAYFAKKVDLFKPPLLETRFQAPTDSRQTGRCQCYARAFWRSGRLA